MAEHCALVSALAHLDHLLRCCTVGEVEAFHRRHHHTSNSLVAPRAVENNSSWFHVRHGVSRFVFDGPHDNLFRHMDDTSLASKLYREQYAANDLDSRVHSNKDIDT